jgi:large subunit ribosomal protein L19
MANLIEEFEAQQVKTLMEGKSFPKFDAGDTLRVQMRISEAGETERTQAYEGLCIGRSGGGLHANFTVRKISYGAGVERMFQLYSPRVVSIDVVKRGKVRRAKLYYMRALRGKATRLAEKIEKSNKE